jgi:hypothetical protein
MPNVETLEKEAVSADENSFDCRCARIDLVKRWPETAWV